MKEITLDAPGKNALSSALMGRTLSEFKAAGDSPVLLTGANGCFSAGLNLHEVASLDAEQMKAFLELLTNLCRAIWNHPGPVVASIEGHAIAGGCVLVQMCDFRIAQTSDKSRFGLNEVALGLRVPPTALAMMRDKIPRQHHEEVFLGSGLHSAKEALRLGLIDAISDDAAGDSRAKLDSLARHPRQAYRAMKHDLRAHIYASEEAEVAFLRHAIPAWTAPEFKQKIQSLLG